MGDEQPDTMQAELKVIPRPLQTPEGGEASATSHAISIKEAQQLGSGLSESELKEKAQKNEADRTETFRDHFEVISLIALWVTSALFSATILIWFWHTLTPMSWHWLADNQIVKLQALATGGIIAGIAAGHIKKRLG